MHLLCHKILFCSNIFDRLWIHHILPYSEKPVFKKQKENLPIYLILIRRNQWNINNAGKPQALKRQWSSLYLCILSMHSRRHPNNKWPCRGCTEPNGMWIIWLSIYFHFFPKLLHILSLPGQRGLFAASSCKFDHNSSSELL